MYINTDSNIRNYGAILTHFPNALAIIKGSPEFPEIHGLVYFYQTRKGVLISADIRGLPYSEKKCSNNIFGFHIHEGTQCVGDMKDSFSKAMSHYNPENCPHPFHSGDLPSLFGNHGFAFSAFLTERFSLSEIVGRTVIIHGNPDDFTTQPSGNAGKKLACGIIGIH